MPAKMTIDLKYLWEIGAITNLQGRDYQSPPGLLRVAHEHGLTSITNVLVSWDAGKRAAVMRCTVTGERGTYTAYGDANPGNVSKNIATATLRMAETRAVNRALRLYTGLGMTTTEELPGDHDDQETPAAPPKADKPAPKMERTAPAKTCDVVFLLASLAAAAEASEAAVGAWLTTAIGEGWRQRDEAYLEVQRVRFLGNRGRLADEVAKHSMERTK